MVSRFDQKPALSLALNAPIGIAKPLLFWLVALGLIFFLAEPARAEISPAPKMRVGVLNGMFSRDGPGLLIDELLEVPEEQPENFAQTDRVIKALGLDVFLLVDVDIDDEGWSARLLAERWGFAHYHVGPSNRGRPSGFDLDRDGRIDEEDRLGFGEFRGQHSMIMFAQMPIQAVASFNTLRLADFAAMPMLHGKPYYEEAAWEALPLTPTGMWQLEINGVQFLTAYASTPAFDGPEDRNGIRASAEVRFWRHYLEGEKFRDDAGVERALDPPFILLGTLNLDPHAGDGDRAEARKLLASPAIQDFGPEGEFGKATADWEERGIGRLRVDYILPSCGFEHGDGGIVFDEALGAHGVVWLELGKTAGC